jgi:vacuolar protein sorting-associated protein 26
MAYFFVSPIDIDIKLESEDSRKQVEIKGEKERTVSCPVYYDGDSVGGQVCPAGITETLFALSTSDSYTSS